jgi:hypothetical protein
MAASQLIENQQRSYEVFGKKHYMECTTLSYAAVPFYFGRYEKRLRYGKLATR